MRHGLGFVAGVGAAAGLLVVGGVLLFASAYTVDEAEQVVVRQFGKPVGDPITEPGLHFRVPFVQDVRRFDKRILVWDGDPNQIPTRGREYISIETTARWKIVDALRLLESVRDEAGAQSRLDDIIDSVVRDKISSTELVEIVRSSDWEVSDEELEKVKAMKSGDLQDDLTREVRMGRQRLTRNILAEASKGMPEKYGIELVDVRINRLNYIPSVRKQVFNRMISERQRIAEQFRSEGQGEASSIRGETALELAKIRSEAKRKAEVKRGEGDAEATAVYNQAYDEDPEFYKFSRTLESYADSLSEKTVLVLGADSEYFEYFRGVELK